MTRMENSNNWEFVSNSHPTGGDKAYQQFSKIYNIFSASLLKAELGKSGAIGMRKKIL